jgi:hypothetical protein
VTVSVCMMRPGGTSVRPKYGRGDGEGAETNG